MRPTTTPRICGWPATGAPCGGAPAATDAGWHLKTPGDGSSRTEHRLPLDGDDVPGELRDEVRAIIRDRELRPVARLRTRRVETPLRDADGRVLALIAQDQVIAETDAGTQEWQEVEVELVDGDAKLLKAVERKLLEAGATPASGPSKLARALGDRLAAGATPASEDPVLRYVREQRDAIQAYDPGVRRGDPESVHKMRVATRRLRSTLKTFKRSFPADSVEFLKPELKWLAGQLGEVRDGQVLEHKLLGAVEQEGPDFAAVADRIREHLDAKVENGRRALDQDLNGERYLRLLDAIDELIDTSAFRATDEVKRARKALAKADRLLDEATLSGEDEQLHEARKAYKQARYAVEVFAPDGRQAGEEAGQRADRPAGRAGPPPGLGGRPGDPARPVPRRRRRFPVRHPLRPPGAGRPGHRGQSPRRDRGVARGRAAELAHLMFTGALNAGRSVRGMNVACRPRRNPAPTGTSTTTTT